MDICGATKAVSGRGDPLVCNLDRGHVPADAHGVRDDGLPPHTRWAEHAAGNPAIARKLTPSIPT